MLWSNERFESPITLAIKLALSHSLIQTQPQWVTKFFYRVLATV